MKKILLYLMAALYIAAGIFHFVKLEYYLPIMPSFLPWHTELIYFTGILEILFGILLIPLKTQSTAAWLIIGLLILVFPANIQMAYNFWRDDDPGLWIAILRLPVQFLFIWWAWLYTDTKADENS